MTRHHPLPRTAVRPDAEFLAEGERIERAALKSLHDCATDGMRRDLKLDWRETPCATASIAAALPSSAIVINRAFLTPAAAIAEAAGSYREAGVARFFLHLPHDRPSLSGELARQGLKEARAWQKFVRLRGTAIPDAPALEIERILPGPAAEAAARIVCAAFDLGGAAEAWIAQLCGHDSWQVFLARVDGVPAGTGALFAKGGVGWCDWGATAPAFRSRGIQLALLRHRLLIAETFGLERVHTCTGAPAPGDPQHSYRNILRCGFAQTVIRRNLAPGIEQGVPLIFAEGRG